ncbi:amidase [Chloroflexota bacterium]
MKNEELCLLTISELSKLIRSGKLSPVELVESMLGRIERLNKQLNAYITVFRDDAVKSAQEAEKAIAGGNYLGPLHGIPVSLKDHYEVKDKPTTYGSPLFANYISQKDAAVVERLEAAGAIIIGKANTHELALGFPHPLYGDTPNPWNLNKASGGSSNGSAVAVSASLCSASIGSDGGGSIRLPASFCGVVGMKPTYGRVSSFGAMLSAAMGTVGPLTKCVEDMAFVMNAISGCDSRDPSSSDVVVPDYAKLLSGNVKNLRVGVPQEYFFDDKVEFEGGTGDQHRVTIIEPEVKEAVKGAIGTLADMGASIEEVSLPHIKYALTALFLIGYPGFSSYFEKYLDRIQECCPEVRSKLEFGSMVPAVAYLKGQRARRIIIDELRAEFEKVDVIVTPTTRITAYDICNKSGEAMTWESTLAVACTAPFNVTGNPAITIPCGFNSAGLPVGLQVVGRPFDEATVLKVAHAYEANTEWHSRRPPI